MTAHSPKGKERTFPSTSAFSNKKEVPPTAMDVDETKRTSQAHLPWVEKYRPMVLTDVISHGDIISTCMQMIGLSGTRSLLIRHIL